MGGIFDHKPHHHRKISVQPPTSVSKASAQLSLKAANAKKHNIVPGAPAPRAIVAPSPDPITDTSAVAAGSPNFTTPGADAIGTFRAAVFCCDD